MEQMQSERIDAHTLAITGLSLDEVRRVVRFGPDGRERPTDIRDEGGRVIVTHAAPGPLLVWA